MKKLILNLKILEITATGNNMISLTKVDGKDKKWTKKLVLKFV